MQEVVTKDLLLAILSKQVTTAQQAAAGRASGAALIL